MLCHGQGDPRSDPFLGGCCYVNGQICPNRWYIEPHVGAGVQSAIVRDSTGASMGTVDTIARSFVGNNPQRRQRVYDSLQGTRYVCKAAVLAVDADPSILNNRAAFEAAWAARPEYQAIGPVWVAEGNPFTYCMSYGPAEQQCCHSEVPEVNATKAANLTTTAVAIRRAAPGAS